MQDPTVQAPTVTTPAPRIIAFDHATIVAADLDRTRAFYVGLLGMAELPRPAFSFGGLWLGAAGDRRPTVHVIEAHGPGTPGPPGPPPGSGPPGFAFAGDPDAAPSTRGPHFALRCGDPRAFVPALRAAGVRFVSEAKTRPDGAVQVFVRDPDGHVVEICSAPPGF